MSLGIKNQYKNRTIQGKPVSLTKLYVCVFVYFVVIFGLVIHEPVSHHSVMDRVIIQVPPPPMVYIYITVTRVDYF